VIVFLLTMGTALLLARAQYRTASARAEIELNDQMRGIGREIIEEYGKYETAIQVLRGYYTASEIVDQDEWMYFSEQISLAEAYPGCFGFSFVRRVPVDEIDRFVEEARAEIPGFVLHDHRSADRPDHTDDHYIIRLTSPESNLAALGLDLASKQINKNVYDRAAMSNSAALSEPFRLFQTGGDEWGMVLVLPVYDQDAGPLSESERIEACIGWVACPIGLSRFFEGEWRSSWDGFGVSMYSFGETKNGVELFSTEDERAMASSSVFDLSFVSNGQSMRLRICPLVEHASPVVQRANALFVLFIMVSLVLTTIVFFSSRTGAQAQVLAMQMTKSLREKQDQHRALIERANAANLAKSGFLANMSHEIRTPLTAVLGYSEVLSDQIRSKTDDEELFRSIDCIQRSGVHLRSIINDILDLSKIDAGKIDIHPVAFDLADLVHEIMDSFEIRAREKKLTLAVEIDQPVPAVLHMDGLRVRQVLINLISNAIKFTDSGSVTLGISHDGEMVSFVVRDTGVGIPEEMMGRLFHPFEQADNSVTRRHEGTGLGLSISQKIARLMHGEIVVESSPGSGSTFDFRFPAPVVSGGTMIETFERGSGRPEAVDTDFTPTNHGRVLLVEDGVDNQRLISHFLRRAGFKVDFASNGVVAIETLSRDCAFDVILMDMQMPVMDGYTAARLLREEGNTIPIIALTAHVMEGDRERCINAGCTDYLSKPIDRDLMISMIQQYTGPGTADSNAA